MTIKVKKQSKSRNVRVGSAWKSRSGKAVIIRLADGTTLLLVPNKRRRSEKSPQYIIYAPEDVVEVVEE